MFTYYHIIWLVISALVIFIALHLLLKYKPEIKQVFTAACVIAVVSELVKAFSAIDIVPSSDGSVMYPYIEGTFVPLHLCSIQIINIFIVRLAKDGPFKETLLAFMYPTCTVGAFMALLMPSLYTDSIEPHQSFISPLAYEYFGYHITLIILGLYIFLSKKVDIRPKHFWSTLGILAALAHISLYLNSLFSVPTYVNGELISVDFGANFFFTFQTPIGIALTEKWHWFIYLAIIFSLAVLFVWLFYIPVFIRAKKNK